MSDVLSTEAQTLLDVMKANPTVNGVRNVITDYNLVIESNSTTLLYSGELIPAGSSVARALYLKPEEVLTANLNWSASGQRKRLCEARDVPINLVRRSDNDWMIGCVPVTSGDVDNCGAILQRPTCRSLGVHQSLWENTTLRKRIMHALSSPCGYIRGEDYLKNLKSEQETANTKHMPFEERTVDRQQYWAACTGEIPRVVEIHLMLLSNTGAAAQMKVISLS